MNAVQFSIWKRAIFHRVKEIKHLSGGVVVYAAQSKVQIDAEIAAHLIMREFGRFQTKLATGLFPQAISHVNHLYYLAPELWTALP